MPMTATILETGQTFPVRKRIPEDVRKEYVRQSELLADSRLDTDADWAEPEIEAHLKIAQYLFFEGSNFCSTVLVNSALTCRPNKFFRRGGNEGVDESPKGKYMPRLISAFDKRIIKRLPSLYHVSDQEKTDFGWNVHDQICYYRAFVSGNTRTARLQMNQVRLILGLDLLVVPATDSKEYKARYRAFRDRQYAAKTHRMLF